MMMSGYSFRLTRSCRRSCLSFVSRAWRNLSSRLSIDGSASVSRYSLGVVLAGDSPVDAAPDVKASSPSASVTPRLLMVVRSPDEKGRGATDDRPGPFVNRSLQVEVDPRRAEPVAPRVAGPEGPDVVGGVEERIDQVAVRRQRVHLGLGRHAGRAARRDELVQVGLRARHAR